MGLGGFADGHAQPHARPGRRVRGALDGAGESRRRAGPRPHRALPHRRRAAGHAAAGLLPCTTASATRSGGHGHGGGVRARPSRRSARPSTASASPSRSKPCPTARVCAGERAQPVRSRPRSAALVARARCSCLAGCLEVQPTRRRVAALPPLGPARRRRPSRTGSRVVELVAGVILAARPRPAAGRLARSSSSTCSGPWPRPDGSTAASISRARAADRGVPDHHRIGRRPLGARRPPRSGAPRQPRTRE